jgi:hypothetical protein
MPATLNDLKTAIVRATEDGSSIAGPTNQTALDYVQRKHHYQVQLVMLEGALIVATKGNRVLALTNQELTTGEFRPVGMVIPER